MTDLEKEIKQLKKSVAQLRFILAAVSVVLGGCCAASRRAATVHAGLAPAVTPDVITAKQFVVVDDAGNQSVVIGPIPGLNSQQLQAGADFRGLAVFGANNTPLASLGIGIPRPPESGSRALHYSELFLQSDNSTHNQAYIRAFGSDNSSSTWLHLSNSSPNNPTGGTMDALALPQGAGQVRVAGSGSVGGRATVAGSAINAAYNGVPGITNCPPPNAACEAVH